MSNFLKLSIISQLSWHIQVSIIVLIDDKSRLGYCYVSLGKLTVKNNQDQDQLVWTRWYQLFETVNYFSTVEIKVKISLKHFEAKYIFESVNYLLIVETKVKI
jgi:hypothetical protein